MLTRTQQAVALAIFVAAGVLRLWAMSGETIHDWDEAYHALVAKNLAVHPFEPTLYDDAALPHDDGAWTRARIFLNKPPLALWAMAGSIRVLGATVFAMRLPSAVLDLLGVWLTFAIGRRLFGPKVALAAMALHALLGNALLWVGGVHATDHVDVQLAFWVELAVYGIVRQQQGSWRWTWLVGAATGAALLTKSAPGALPLLLLAGCGGKGLKENARWTALAATIALAIVAPWNIYLRAKWPGLSANAAHAQLSHLWSVWEDHGGHPLFHLEKLGQLHGALAVIAVGWFIVSAAKSKDLGARLLALWWVAPLMLFSLSATKMPGYLGIASPAVCLMTAAFAVAAFERYRPWVRVVAAAVIASALVVDVEGLRRLGPSSSEERTFAATMRALPPRTIVLGVRPAIQAMFHGAHAAYRDHWSAEQRAAVERAGYQVRIASCDGSEGLALPAQFCAAP
ncbi:MAG: glycosyl transferase family 39 [Myxococcaceae bacterium]|nr:glycosyl transferase family 39 [Myxococcaceae bacterium]